LREGASAGDLWKILVNPLFHPNSAQAADCNPLKVLIVEDDPVGLELLTEVLQSLEAKKKERPKPLLIVHVQN